MLERDLARDLIPLVNIPDNYDRLLGYVNYRINLLQQNLNNSVDINDILRYQGSIKELQRFTSLKDEVLADSESKK